MYRRFRLLPGVYLHVSRSGIGWSVGPRGLHFGMTARGTPYYSVGLGGGSGIWWRQDLSPRRGPRCELCAPHHWHIGPGLAAWLLGAPVWFLICLAIIRWIRAG